jgi:hypothetical protein
MATELIERPLTPIEIKQRQVDHLRLLTEIDNYQSEIDEHRRCAKDAANEVARLQSRERELRRELRSGTVWEAQHVEPRQKSLEFADTLLERPTAPGIDAMSDEPDPETDPPERDSDGAPLPPPAYPQFIADQKLEESFRRLCPVAKDGVRLHSDLAVALQRHEGAVLPSLATVDGWHPSTVRFQEVAAWVCFELADMNRTEHPEFDCFLRVRRQPMPARLAELVMPPKRKRGARPLTQPKRRRSGSTAETP